MKIAIVGAGIAGLTAGWLLAPEHQVTVWEAAAHLGGHTNTVHVALGGRDYALDTGFIVYNERTYPNFTRLLERLAVATQPSDMSFSVRSTTADFEYCGSSLNGLFAQRSNLCRPSFWRMLRDIVRFNRHSLALLDQPDDSPRPITLGSYVRNGGYGPEFIDRYLLPMAAAIWSAPPEIMEQFPARYFVQFFRNHGLLELRDRPQWRVIQGGSDRYVARIADRLSDIRLNTPIATIHREHDAVYITTTAGQTERFDHVVIGAHADQALRLLAYPTPPEREILGAFGYQTNQAVLHTDERLLPRRRRAWASWNYHLASPADRAGVAVTYWLNRLQSIAGEPQFCVTLNRGEAVRPETILRRIEYDHPVFTPAAVAAQRRWHEISGTARTHFCGAYWGYGFHEDGVNSALAVARQFGISFT